MTWSEVLRASTAFEPKGRKIYYIIVVVVKLTLAISVVVEVARCRTMNCCLWITNPGARTELYFSFQVASKVTNIAGIGYYEMNQLDRCVYNVVKRLPFQLPR